MLKVININSALIFFVLSAVFSFCQSPESGNAEMSSDSLQLSQADSIDQATGLVVDEALPLVIGNCTGCHSAKLITQNRASREGWKSMIVWMQETQKLWDLGENEDQILDYLAEHYAAEQTGRRKNLQNIQWYDLETQ
ncbi:hypothetical protein OKW21_003720 [Catalinimonas alkaloidigena]|uniref:cytochrome C n=1 Tax=Catalinimonas alkaloidigena TaxID=1075417 RepID=UPI0024068030|nr:cytochrome C [Catalinimonas alkaloidigena]MDF9798457.1 hypothetical protein [Catalinimonas alkaloidigena]